MIYYYVDRIKKKKKTIFMRSVIIRSKAFQNLNICDDKKNTCQHTLRSAAATVTFSHNFSTRVTMPKLMNHVLPYLYFFIS